MRTNGLGRSVMAVVGFAALLAAGPAAAICPGDCPVAGGGTQDVDCLVEYFGLTTTPGASRIVRCVDGSVCDRDGAENGSCRFEVSACLNQSDPALPECTATGVAVYDIRGATSNSELGGLRTKVRALLPTSDSVCSSAQTITVPLNGDLQAPVAGRVRLQSVARGPEERDSDRVELVCDPPPRPLGRRMFSVNPATSPLQAVVSGLTLNAGQFRGFLELEAGIPDDNGFAVINAVSSSEYIFADLRPLASQIVCLRPIVPAQNVGVVACKGQADFSYLAQVNHIAGVVGEDGFTEADCRAMCSITGCGTVEGPSAPHPGVCNGPIQLGPGGRGDSGRGAVAISPDPVTGQGGLPFELSFVNPGRCRGNTSVACANDGDCGAGGKCMQACGDGPPGMITPLPFFSGPVQVNVANAEAIPGNDRRFSVRGTNFSCANWSTENGPGKLVFGIPQLHGLAITPGTPPADLVTAFVLSDK